MLIREVISEAAPSEQDQLKIVIRRVAKVLNIRTVNIDSAEFKNGKLVSIKLKDGDTIPVPQDWDKKWVKNTDTGSYEKTGTANDDSAPSTTTTSSNDPKDQSLWGKIKQKFQ